MSQLTTPLLLLFILLMLLAYKVKSKSILLQFFMGFDMFMWKSCDYWIGIYIYFGSDILFMQNKYKIRLVLNCGSFAHAMFHLQWFASALFLSAIKMHQVFLELFQFIAHPCLPGSLLGIYVTTKACEFHPHVSYM